MDVVISFFFRRAFRCCRTFFIAGLAVIAAADRVAASQSVELTWNVSTTPDVVGYKIYYGTSSSNYPNSIAFADVSDVVIPGLSDGQTYYFAASAIDTNGSESPLSNQAIFTVPAPNPITIQAQTSTAALGGVELSWTTSADSDVFAYAVRYGTQSGVYTNTATYYGTTDVVMGGLTGGMTYYFTVSPVDTGGIQSLSSPEVAYSVPPATPPVLQAKPPANSSGIELSWNALSDPAVTGYLVDYGTQSGVYNQSFGAGNVNDVVVHGLTAGQTYYFAVAAVDAYGNQGPNSAEISSVAAGPVALAEQVQGTTLATRAVNVTWSASADSDVYGYSVNYWTQGMNYTNYQDFFSATNGMISGLDGGKTYYFNISPIDSYGVEPVASPNVSFPVPYPPPIVPHAAVPPGLGGVQLSWNAVANEGVLSYNIYYGTGSGSYSSSVNCGNVTNYVVRGLSAGQTYYFTVTSLDGYGNESAYSTEAVAVAPLATPMLLTLQPYADESGRVYGMDITTPSTVSGPWEMDSSSDLRNWSYYTSGTGPGNGDGHDVDVYVSVDTTVPQLYFRVVNN